jgi:eukaryotic-like serine/threonine-protein kinase
MSERDNSSTSTSDHVDKDRLTNTFPERTRQGVALVEDSTCGADSEFALLLQRRLRQTSLLFLCGYAAFFIRDLVWPATEASNFQVRVLAIATVIQTGLAALLRSPWPKTLTRLRTLEWVGFAVCVAVLGSTQFSHFVDPRTSAQYLSEANPRDGQVVLANTWVIPWFALIIGHAVLLPHRGGQVLIGSVILALAPVIVTLAASVACPELAAAPKGLLFAQFAIWGSVATGLGVYGATRTERLRAEAYKARRFGQYRLTRKLGSGGMGEVYLAEHLLLRRPSVVKVIRADRAREPAVLKRFEREVQILATLTHWNTVAVFDYGYTTNGTFYYVMEYLPGLDLDELVCQYGPLQPGRVVYLLRQLCAALNEAHTAGLIHRDVKPSNVMVCRRGGVRDVAKLLDFGLVQGDESETSAGKKLTVEGTVLGTPHFMSPEQAAGKPTDCRSDIYSLGTTAYFLLCGKPPFHTGRIMEIIAAHLMIPPPPLATVNPTVPDDLAAIIMRCLLKKPEERFRTVAELDAALAKCCSASTWGNEQATEWWATHGGKLI